MACGPSVLLSAELSPTRSIIHTESCPAAVSWDLPGQKLTGVPRRGEARASGVDGSQHGDGWGPSGGHEMWHDCFQAFRSRTYDGWLGRHAYDANGDKIGEIDHIFYDDRTSGPSGWP